MSAGVSAESGAELAAMGWATSGHAVAAEAVAALRTSDGLAVAEKRQT